VFGLDQYLGAVGAGYAWQGVFGDLFQTEPFFAIGATLSDEVDLAEILMRGTRRFLRTASHPLWC
jgi:hypothetical protein